MCCQSFRGGGEVEKVVERKATTSAGAVEVYADAFNELNIRF